MRHEQFPDPVIEPFTQDPSEEVGPMRSETSLPYYGLSDSDRATIEGARAVAGYAHLRDGSWWLGERFYPPGTFDGLFPQFVGLATRDLEPLPDS